MPHLLIDPVTGEPLPIEDSYRLEPLPRSNEVDTGLAARTHDAAWLLTRQWQFGEFAGQDAGSPLTVTLVGHSDRISGWRPRPESAEPLTPEPDPPRWRRWRAVDGPLDRYVEQERATAPDLRARIEGGLHLASMLIAAGHPELVGTFVEAFPVRVPSALPASPVTLLADRVPDALALSRAVVRGELPTSEARPVLERWHHWWKEQTGARRTEDTYNEHRFEHRLELSCGDMVLRAEEYLGDGLDWHSVDRVPDGTPAGRAPVYRFKQDALVSPVRYGGLPADRFWQMEDREVDLASAEAANLDTGRLLLIGFAQVYGNDWFLVPLEVPVGSLTVLDRFDVTDSFGDTWRVGRAGSAESGWDLFTVHGVGGGLLVMPTAPGQAGPVLEAVALARDELANSAWAIEGTVSSAVGEPLDRRGAWQRRVAAALPPGEPPASGEPPAYAVQTIVPDYWLPLVAEQTGVETIRFRLGSLEQPAPGRAASRSEPSPPLERSRPRGRLLREGQWVHEEEVPREGAQLTRRSVLSRWYDGSWHSWTRREKNAGTGESSSGLAFDVVRPSEPWP